MTEDHDSRISDLYLQSSQEAPPAHVDRAVMGMARQSVRRRGFSPFGNHWVAGGAMLGVVMMSVLLILTVQQPDSYVPVQDLIAPSSEDLSGARKEAARLDESPAVPAAPATEQKREAPAAPKAKFDFYERLPEKEAAVPDEGVRARMQQAPAAPADTSASSAIMTPAGTYYLQVGSFLEQGRAVALRNRLSELGFRCEVQEIGIDNTDVYHRVRVGPFTDPAALDTSRQRLGELGIETQAVTDRE